MTHQPQRNGYTQKDYRVKKKNNNNNNKFKKKGSKRNTDSRTPK